MISVHDSINIMIVGVGGQGTLLASRVLGDVFMHRGFDVKISEVHGMSQRGGSVVTYVRCGEKVYSPIIEPGCADYVLAFEQLEAARWLSYLKEDGVLVASSQQIDPMPVITGAAKYPENIFATIEETGARTMVVDALALAEKAGSSKAVNTVMLGALSSLLDIPAAEWESALAETVPEKFKDLNIAAFRLGRGDQSEK